MFNQFNVENKWKTFTDKIVSISGELFVENNVDISGNLTLKGSLGILDSSTNDISYGTTGSVLTSNGSSASPSWVEPYILRVYKSTDQTFTDETYTKIVNWTIDTNVSTSQGSSDFNTTTSEWSPSISGTYIISAQLYFGPPGGTHITSGDLVKILMILRDNANNVIRYAEYMSDYTDDGVFLLSVNFNDILYTDNTTSYYIEIFINRRGTGVYSRLLGSSAANFFTAYKIA